MTGTRKSFILSAVTKWMIPSMSWRHMHDLEIWMVNQFDSYFCSFELPSKEFLSQARSDSYCMVYLNYDMCMLGFTLIGIIYLVLTQNFLGVRNVVLRNILSIESSQWSHRNTFVASCRDSSWLEVFDTLSVNPTKWSNTLNSSANV